MSIHQDWYMEFHHELLAQHVADVIRNEYDDDEMTKAEMSYVVDEKCGSFLGHSLFSKKSSGWHPTLRNYLRICNEFMLDPRKYFILADEPKRAIYVDLAIRKFKR